MTAPFAAVQALITQGIEASLPDSSATYRGGEPFGVILERAQTDAFGGGGEIVDAPSTTCAFHIRHTPGLSEGDTLAIDGVAYTVAGAVNADSGGWVVVMLYPKA